MNLNPIQAYVQGNRADYQWKRVTGKSGEEFELTSQIWMGFRWQHSVTLQTPGKSASRSKTAILVVTGDRIDAVDLPFGQALSDRSGLPVVTLFDVPNQPLFGAREDDLIAYSFEQFLSEAPAPFEHGASAAGQWHKWPLLLPMVNSVVSAMDLVEQATHGRIRRFIVTGESKRGWTTWLVGALKDPRVVAIAPVSFDNLNLVAQLKHQVATWGHLSEMLSSYSGKGLIEEAETPKGEELIRIVDPFCYLADIHIPVLMIRGSNDRYWAADATNIYWDKVASPKELLILPNEGHDFMRNPLYLNALAEFARDFGELGRKSVAVHFARGEVTCEWGPGVKEIRLWRAESTSLDFRDSHWEQAERRLLRNGEKEATLSLPLESSSNSAFFVEFVGARGESMTSTIHILNANRASV